MQYIRSGRRCGGALPPIVLANEKVGRAPARSLPLLAAADPPAACPVAGEGDKYVCKSCRLAVTREDGRRPLILRAIWPSARSPPRRPPPRPRPQRPRRNYTNISFYINSAATAVRLVRLSQTSFRHHIDRQPIFPSSSAVLLFISPGQSTHSTRRHRRG